MKVANKGFVIQHNIFWQTAGICLLITILFIPALYAQSPNVPAFREAGFPFIQNFSAWDYNAHQQNWAVVQDQRGVMYFGNVAGVLEYDGVSWRLITMPQKSLVRALAVDSNGCVYVGAHGDFGYLSPDALGQMQYRSLLAEVSAEDRNFNNIWKIHITPDGIYFRTNTHIFRWSNQQMRVWKPDTEFHRSFFINNTFYVRQWDLGLYKFVGDSLRLTPGGKLFADKRIDLMLPLNGEQILLGTKTNGLFVFSETALHPFESEVNEFLRKNQLYDGAILPNGTIALATLRGGLAIIDRHGHFLQHIDQDAGLRDNTIWALSSDREGGLWLALNDGLVRVEMPSPLSLYAENLGIQSNVESILRHQGQLYAATGLGVYYLQTSATPGKPSVFRAVSGIASQAWYLLSAGKILLAATSTGIYQIAENKAVQLIDLLSFSLFCSRTDTNKVYVGLVDGLAVLELSDGQWKFAGRVSGITEEIRSISEDTTGNLWLGTQFQGVLHLKFPSGHKSFGQSEPQITVERFASENRLPEGEVNVYRVNQHIMFGTAKGIQRFDSPNRLFTLDSTFGNVFTDTAYAVHRIATDPKGNIWIERGWDNQFEIGLLFLQDKKSNQWTYSPLQRMADLGPVWAIHPDREQEAIVWFGGNGWIARYNRLVYKDYLWEYTAMVRRVIAGGDSLIYGGVNGDDSQFSNSTSSVHVLNYQNNALRFEFAAPSYDASSQNRYRHFLEGFDNNWSGWNKETKKDYTNLPEGNYHFHVQAKNIYQHLSSEDMFPFTILPPWYRSWWAYGIYVVVFGIFVIGLVQFQARRVRKGERESARLKEAEIFRQKNIELKEKNKELQFVLQKLQSAQDSLIDSESRFRSVAESANDAIITTDKTGNITFWNKRAEVIFGYKKRETLGKPLTMLMPERYRKAHLKGLKNFHSTGRGRIMGQIVDIQAIKKDGKEFPIELTLGAWESNESKFVTGIVRDITERKQKEEALQNTQTQLFQSEKMATLGKLSAGMAHELNNPVASAQRSAVQLQKVFFELQHNNLNISNLNLSGAQKKMFAALDQLAKERAEQPSNLDALTRSDREQEIEMWLKTQEIENAWQLSATLVSLDYDTDRMTELGKKFTTKQLKPVIKWQSAIFTIYSLLSDINLGMDRVSEIVKAFKTYTYMDQAPIKNVDVQKDLENTLIILHSKLKSGIKVRREYAKNLPDIMAYGGELNQVWTNIIDNALHAMEDQGELIVKTYKDDSWIVVEITDNGPGIPEEIQPKIFDPFFTTKPVGSGIGLGLNISHNIIIQKHRGQITVSSQPGKTTFAIRLPVNFETTG
jgi:PAS domain S-box-containing protein